MADHFVDNVIITDNVLYFLNKNIHCASPDIIIKCCCDHFRESDIDQANTILLKHSKIYLDSIDSVLSERASKRKRLSKFRSTEAVNLRHMLNILDALSTHGINLNIHYANVDFIPNVNPESVTMPAMASRISIAENDIQSLKLTTEASIDKLSGEYDNLKRDTQITINANQMLNKQNELLLNDNKLLEGNINDLNNRVQGLIDQNKQLLYNLDLLTVKLSTLLSLTPSLSHTNYSHSTSNPPTEACPSISSIGPSTFLLSNSTPTDDSLLAPILPTTTIPSQDQPLPIISSFSSTSNILPSVFPFNNPPFDISTPYSSLPMHASANSLTCTSLNESLSIHIPNNDFTKPISQSPHVNNATVTHEQCLISPTPSNTSAPPSPFPSPLAPHSPPVPTPTSLPPSSTTPSSPTPLPHTSPFPAPLAPIPYITNFSEHYNTYILPPPITSCLTLPTENESHFSSLPPPAAFIALADISPPPIDSQNSIKTLNSLSNSSSPSTYVKINPSSSSSNDDNQSHVEQIGTHKRNVFATNKAVAAAIVAIKTGSTELQAMLVGSDAAKKAMASFSSGKANKTSSKSKTKKGKAKNNDIGIQQDSNQSGSLPNVHACSGMTFNPTASSGIQVNTPAPDAVRSKNKYVRGTASDSNRSLAGELPDHFKNKVIVISPVSKDLSRVQFKEEIDRIAGRNINFLFEPIILNKAYQKTRTIAIELSPDDYTLLSNRNIWNPNMKISEFDGNRFWRRNSMRLTPTERKNSVKDSWKQ